MIKVLRLSEIKQTELISLLSRYHLTLNLINPDGNIPGSFWGDEEAGLIGNQLYARADTPVHSILHESCHFICMTNDRRLALHTNAGGTTDEENAVCFLQILLSQELSFMGKQKMMRDMDSWGYSFRLGSTNAWYEHDAEDVQQWLIAQGLVDEDRNITFNLRQ